MESGLTNRKRNHPQNPRHPMFKVLAQPGVRLALGVLWLVVFLEISSALVLHTAISQGKLARFHEIYLVSPEHYEICPPLPNHLHPPQISHFPHRYLGWVSAGYIDRANQYLAAIGSNRSDSVSIVFLGGSTTIDGYPAIVETALNRRLAARNLSLRAVSFNLGEGGWTSFTAVQSYFYYLKYGHPDIIVLHENANDGDIVGAVAENHVMTPPRISRQEEALVRYSRTYALTTFLAHLVDFRLHGGIRAPLGFEPVADPTEDEFLRNSFYINEPNGRHKFFLVAWPGLNRSLLDARTLLSENDGGLIRYARSEGTVVVLTTQYKNITKTGGGEGRSNTSLDTMFNLKNEWIREISRENDAPLIDLALLMEPADSLLSEDGLHWKAGGIELKGNLVAAGLLPVILTRYNLTDRGLTDNGAR